MNNRRRISWLWTPVSWPGCPSRASIRDLHSANVRNPGSHNRSRVSGIHGAEGYCDSVNQSTCTSLLQSLGTHVPYIYCAVDCGKDKTDSRQISAGLPCITRNSIERSPIRSVTQYPLRSLPSQLLSLDPSKDSILKRVQKLFGE